VQNINSATSIGENTESILCILLTNLHSEEQKPLEEFFAAKGLKTRNEMLDDVRLIPET